MAEILKDKRIVLGVTGSIACYKAADLASKLAQSGALVDVILTRSAAQFIAPLTFRSLTHREVVTDLFDPASQYSVEHVALAEAADIIVVAPATANLIAKAALGLADDLLTTTLLATRAQVLLAPAMDAHMYDNPATQENLTKLKARGYTIVGPTHGRLASGLVGMGRMVEPAEIIEHIRIVLGRKGDLAGRRIVVSAGGTQEPIDIARVVTNRSSGKMGYALARAARDRGAEVTLVAAPTALPDPVGVDTFRVTTAQEMRDAVLKACQSAHALIMAAAVADYRPAKPLAGKMKKGPQALALELEKTPDIVSEVRGDKLVKVGFAAESENLIENARAKLREKKLHLIVANDISRTDSGFGTDANQVVLVGRDGKAEELPLMSKEEVAHLVLDRVVGLLA